MKMINTESFTLACNHAGDEDSSKLAICIPGRLDTKDYANFTSHLEYLAGLGFYALAFDPPGTWDSPGGIELCTTTNYLKAVAELIEYFGNRPTLLLGHSRGGATAMLAADANDGVEWLVVVNASYGPPTAPNPDRIKNDRLTEHRDLPPGDTRTEKQQAYELPLEYFKDGAQYDPLAALRNFVKPKLLFHGTKDEFTGIDEVRAIFSELPSPKVFHALDVAHDYRLDQHSISEVNEAMGKFLRDYPEKT